MMQRTWTDLDVWRLHQPDNAFGQKVRDAILKLPGAERFSEKELSDWVAAIGYAVWSNDLKPSELPASTNTSQAELSALLKTVTRAIDQIDDLRRPAFEKMMANQPNPPGMRASLCTFADRIAEALDGVEGQGKLGRRPDVIAGAVEAVAIDIWKAAAGRVEGGFTTDKADSSRTGPYPRFLDELFRVFGLSASGSSRATQKSKRASD